MMNESWIHQDQDQLANARVADADAPSHHYNRSKPRKLLAIQQGGIIGTASESKGRDLRCEPRRNPGCSQARRGGEGRQAQRTFDTGT
jgi:hypothetical protein